MNMIQHTNRILLNSVDHVIEHLERSRLVLNNRILLAISDKTNTLTKKFHIIDMIHPLAVDRFQKNYSFQLTKLLCFRELSFLHLIKLHCLFLQLLFDLIFSLTLNHLSRKRLDRND